MDVIVSGVEHKLCFCKPVDESAGGYEQTGDLKIFGTPEYRRFDRGMEEWEYRSLSLISGEYKVVVITFEDGRVSGMDTFTTRDFQEHPLPPAPCIH